VEQDFDRIVDTYLDTLFGELGAAWDKLLNDCVQWTKSLLSFTFEDFYMFATQPLMFPAWLFANRLLGLMDIWSSFLSGITGSPIVAFVAAAVEALPFKQIKAESATRVMRGDEAVRAGLELVLQMFTSAARTGSPSEVKLSQRVRAFTSRVGFIDKLLDLNFTGILVSQVKARVRAIGFALFNMVLRVCLSFASVALLIALKGELEGGVPPYYSKRFLGQSNPRVRETIKVQHRIPKA